MTQSSLLATLFDNQPARPATAPTPWLIAHLTRAGHLDETGLSRRARPRPCPLCRTWTVAGIDDDIAAFSTHADPTPLNQLGEVAALIAGRRTVELVHTGGRLQLEQRWADHIETRPAGQGRYDVLAVHACGQPIPDDPALTLTSAHAPSPAASLPPGSPAPF